MISSSTYISYESCVRETQPCIGILLTNLGTPDAPTTKAVRAYLKEFLQDPRVIEIPKLIWSFILYGIILPFRSPATAKKYKEIWTEEGSPLLAITKKQAVALEKKLNATSAVPIKVVTAMRYGNPSIEEGLEILRNAHARKICIMPLYPQYASATTGSTFEKVTEILNKWRWLPELRLINHYADFPDYIDALADSVTQHWEKNVKGQRLLFSFHGLPKKTSAGDPYSCYCKKTARLVAEKLSLDDQDWQVVFQSRLGKAEWLQPYCVETLVELADNGVDRVDVICPGFAADCLETLEEISMTNWDVFLDAGGKALSYIPALNDSPQHIDMMYELAKKHLSGWL